MKPITSRILQLSLIAGGIAILALTPRAAHAVTAALVQVANTISTPANTLDSSRAASQQVLLQTPFGATVTAGEQEINMVQLSPTTGITSNAGYQVPVGFSLVVTGIDLVLYGRMTGPLFMRIRENSGDYANEQFNQMNAGFYSIAFPSGVVYPAGSNVILDNSQGNANLEATIHGYLTAQ